MKISNILLEQPLRNVDFCRGVSRADAEDPAYLFGSLTANPGDIFSKHLDGASESEGLNDWNQMPVGPVVQNGRKFVDVGSSGIVHKLRVNPILVRLPAGRPSEYQLPELPIIRMKCLRDVRFESAGNSHVTDGKDD